MTTSTTLLFADLTGVAVFAASGASAAVAKRLDLFGVVFVGVVAALGGGIFRDLVIEEVPVGLRRLAVRGDRGGLGRDLLTGEIPVVLRREIYAVAALAGSVVVALLSAYGQAKALPLTAAATFVFMLRVVSLRRRWSAPVATLRPPRTGTRGPGAEPRPRRRPWRLLATVRGARPGNWQPGAPDVTSVASGGERCRRWLC